MAKVKTIYRYKKPWWSRAWDKILFLAALALFFLFYPGENIYTLPGKKELSKVQTIPFSIPAAAPYPVNISGIYPGPEISAVGLVILDMDSGVTLFGRNEKERLAPASTTKILTALVALDQYQLDDVLTVKTIVTTGQTTALVAGEKITVENLLYGALIASGNDAAYTLAENYPGGVEKFVDAMNEKAKNIGLTNSSFTNPIGFDNPEHKMTPEDLVRLARVALRNKTIAKMVAIPQITISDTTHTYFHSLRNVNALLGKVPGVGGIKTGWTSEAGENLVTLVERNGHRIIVVVLDSKDRFGETEKLINWVFGSWEWEDYQKKSREISLTQSILS